LLVVANIITTALAAWAGVSLYAPFQEWFDHRFLGMPVPPVHLLPWYSARLAESLDIERIADLLRSQVFPDLLVRQAALVRLLGDPNQPQTCRVVPLLQLQVSDRQLPLQANLPGLLEAAGTVSSPDLSQTNHELSWVRLVLSLAVDGKPIGLCLLGRRDPDDQFAPNEIQLIQALMDQTALALVHIDLASRLRSLVQADIQRQEAERRDLARELHDDLLGKMAVLAQESDWLEQESSIVSTERALLAYQEAVQEIRRLISNLRSAVLAYGLQLALEDLAEELQDNSLNRPQPAQVLLELSGDHSRYPEQVELHLFRIVQQACTNSLQHANPQTVLIQGDFQPGSIQLKICDDGSGFQTQHTLDLAQLLVNNQFGIVGMFERAMLIRAELTIDSDPGQGTQVNVSWRETAAGEESRNGKSHENNRTD
jgi:signal transduction histidine kinase